VQTLAQTLQDHDRGHLKVIADLWDLELPNDPQPITIQVLSGAMLERTPEILETLPGGAMRALERMLVNGGRFPMEALMRQFGPLREMGPGKRDRVKPWKEPASPLEMLWYRGLMSKAFADSEGGPQEFGFVPDDLLERIPEVTEPEVRALGEPVATPKRIIQSNRFAVDDATTVLAAHRRAGSLDHVWVIDFLRRPESLALIEGLLESANVLGSAEQIRDFLQLPHDKAIEFLIESWKRSTKWNDLSHTPDLSSPTGDWPNDPLAGRRAALALLDRVPTNTWWSVPGFVDSVFEEDPGFMRPPGGFESWYLQSGEDGGSLHGFEAWHKVEGQYLRYLIVGPMLWLGIVEVSRDHSAFRLLEASTSEPLSKEGRATAWPDGRIRVATEADRTLRYQLARLCSWERIDGGAYFYRLTARSLEGAEAQGLTATHAHKVLSEIPAPEGILKAVERWGRKGSEANLERQTILQVDDPEILIMLADDKTARRYMGEKLGPISVIVEARKWRKLQEAALRLGLLIGSPKSDEMT
jgi:hypothetical protein